MEQGAAMSTIIKTKRLELVLQTPEEMRALVKGMEPSAKAEISADWLSLLDSAEAADPWIHGFRMVRQTDGAVIGTCGFKGPPTPEGVVELAYAVGHEHRNQGYASEAAAALVSFAFSDMNVRVVRAHTLPLANASTRVLTRCGFRHVGEVIDPEDGLVWRWEINRGLR